MPKRRVFEPEQLYRTDEPKSVLNEEWDAYEGVSRDYYALKNTEPGQERNRKTAIMFTRLAELQIASDRVDSFLENNDKKAEGDTEELSDEFSKLKYDLSVIGGVFRADFPKKFEADVNRTLEQVDRVNDIIFETTSYDYDDHLRKNPLPVYFGPLLTNEPPLTDAQIRAAVDMEREGTLKGYLEENGYIAFDRAVEEERIKEKKPFSKLFEEKIAEKGYDNGENNEEEVEEKLNEEQVNKRREDVEEMSRGFLSRYLGFSFDPFSEALFDAIVAYGYKTAMLFKFDGKTPEEVFTEEAAIEDPKEREEALNNAIKNELANGTKTVTYVEPEVLTDGKLAPGRELLIKEDPAKLQKLSDAQQKYEMVLDQHLLEFNNLKEEFGKTQNLPKANFDGKSQEGSEYYRNVTSSLNNCIRMLEDMKSGKRTYSSDKLEGAYNAFKTACDEYVKNRQGTLFGPITDNGKIRLGLGSTGSVKADNMMKEINEAAAGISSDLVVDEKGTTFNRLLANQQKEYIDKMAEKGLVKKQPLDELENKYVTDELKKINTMEYVHQDYTGRKNEKYLTAARDVILGRHFDIVNHGAKATKYDLARIRNFDLQVNDLSTNAAFRNMIDKQGVKETTKKWPEVEKNTDFLRSQIRENLNNSMVEKGTSPFSGAPYTEPLTVAEYVSGITSKKYRADVKPDNIDAEEKIRSLANDPDGLDGAYNRMTEVLTGKLLLENDKFGKEFVNNMASDEKINDIAVYDQLKFVTKQLLVQNHVLEGKKISKALNQLESGKLGEDLVNSVKEVYKNEQKKRKETELNIKAEDLNVDKKLKDAGLTMTEAQYEKKQEVRATQNPYIQEGREELNKLSGMGKGFMKEGGEEVDQEKIQTIIKAVTAEYVFRNRDKFPTKESIDKMEKSFYQNKEAKAGILFLADQKTGAELADIIRTNSFSKELSGAMDKIKETAGKTFEPISKELREQRPDLVTKRYEEIKDAKNVLKVVDKSKEVKMPEHLKAEAPKAEKAAQAGGPKLG